MMPYMSASINKSMSRLVLLLALLIKTCNSVALSDNDTVLTQKEAVDGCLSDHKSYLIPQKFMKENLYVRKEIISQMQNTTAWIDGEKHDIGCTTGTCYRILRQRTEMATRYPFICGTSILGLKANVTFDKAKAMCENEANVTVNEVMGTMEKQKIESDGNFWLFNVKEINGNKTCASIYEEENFTLSTECRPCDDKMMAVCIEPGMIPSYREVLILSLERQVLPELVIQGQHSESTAETQRPSTEAQEKQDTSPFSMAYYVEDNTAQSHSLNNTIEFIVLVAVNGFFIVVSLFVMILLWKRVSRIERLRNLDTNKFSGSNMLLDVPEHIYNSCSEETFRKGYQAKNKKKVKVGRENKDRLYFKIPADRSCCKTIDVPDRIGLAEENPYAELSDDLKRSFDDLHHGLCVADVANNRASYFDMSKGKLPHDLGKINHINPASTITDDELDDTDVAPTVKTGRDAVPYPNESGTLNSFFPIPAIVVDSSKTGKGIEKHKLRIKQLGNGTIKTRKAMDTENKGNNNFLEVPKNTKRHTNNGIRLPAMEDAYMRMNSPDMTK